VRYLELAASEPDDKQARMRLWNIATRAWIVGAPVPLPSAPRRALRASDAAETITSGCHPGCTPWRRPMRRSWMR
jgi:hypothetical protein